MQSLLARPQQTPTRTYDERGRALQFFRRDVLSDLPRCRKDSETMQLQDIARLRAFDHARNTTIPAEPTRVPPDPWLKSRSDPTGRIHRSQTDLRYLRDSSWHRVRPDLDQRRPAGRAQRNRWRRPVRPSSLP